ncbi:MAG TPA: 4Fe-4S dicluster domain-containing protein [Sedimentisphaerales bacterium]|nr:4Fe-4S dicluster domain-containing protein [Sedimentisphaerales bacterium]
MSEILPGPKRNRIRLSVRVVCLLAAGATLWIFVSPWVPSLSPFVAFSSAIATRSFPTLAWLGALVGVVAMVKHRIFCRWVCPMGLCLEAASGVGRRLKRRSRRWPSLGRWIVLLTLGGACLGYPLLLWLDPLALFAGGGLVVVFVLTVVWPDAWCGCVCPLGASEDLLHAAFASVRSLIGPKLTVHTDTGLSRRVVLGAAVGAGSAGVLGLFRKSDPQPLRPPNARTGTQFSCLCTRCGNCVRVCPTGIIERDRGGHGLASLLTPVLSFEKGCCREDCTRCTEVCPSGAILPLRIEDKLSARIGRPRVDVDLCLLSEDRECSACARWCPCGAIRYVFSETTYSLQVQIDPRKCNGCGACEAACPTKPRKAIVVQPV